MDEADYLPLSSLSQYLWCQRRCALIHIEQVWVENLFTAEGRVMHEKAHEERFQESKG
ncbi:MAG: Dna2/Cas4 domain-containing protein, partial [Candidatus Omnitrophica bacterium]|nr:Dna2/Cas4 domain-containing protein [Candidatus Omnitrophota bacterium]